MAQTLDKPGAAHPLVFRSAGLFHGIELGHRQLRGVVPDPPSALLFKEFSERIKQSSFLQQHFNSCRFPSGLNLEAAVGNERRRFPAAHQNARFTGKSCEVVPIGRLRDEQGVQMAPAQLFFEQLAPIVKRSVHK